MYICLWIVTLLYIGQAAALFYNHKFNMGIVFLGYALANIGLIRAS
jgi:hypothetical protein